MKKTISLLLTLAMLLGLAPMALPVSALTDAEITAQIQIAWENAIGSNPTGVTLADLQAHATASIPADASGISATVTDNGNGTYSYTYTGGTVSKTHTMYIDTPYTLDFSSMSKEEINRFSQDVYRRENTDRLENFSYEVPIKTLTIDENGIAYGGYANPRPSALLFPVYFSKTDFVYEATLSIPSVTEGNSASLIFGSSDFAHNYQFKFFRHTQNPGIQIYRENGIIQNASGKDTVSAVGHQNLDTRSAIGTGDGKIDENKYFSNETNQYIAKPDATFTYRLEVKSGTAYAYIDGVSVGSIPLTGNLKADLNGGFGIGSAGLNLQVKKISILPLKTDAEIKTAITESWENVIAKNPADTTLSGMITHAQNCLTNDAKSYVDVTVTEQGNGKFDFIYTSKLNAATNATHTLYVDTAYHVDFSTMSDAELTKFSNDLYKRECTDRLTNYSKVVPIQNLRIDNNGIYFGSWNNPRPSALLLPVYYSYKNYAFEAKLSIPSVLEGGANSSSMIFGSTEFDKNYQFKFFRANQNPGIQIYRETGIATSASNIDYITAFGHQNIDTRGYIGTDTGKIDASKYEDTTSYTAKSTSEFTYRVEVIDETAHAYIDGVKVGAIPLTGNLKADLNGGFGFGSAGLNLQIKSISINPIHSDTDLKKMMQKSWETFVMTAPTGTTQAQITTHAQNTLASDAIAVTVVPNGTKYDVTYTAKENETITATHTYYADSTYTVDFSNADEAAAFMNDIYKKPGNPNSAIYTCNTSNGAFQYASWSNSGTSAIHFPVYMSKENYVFEATLSMPGTFLEGVPTSGALIYGVQDVDHYLRMNFFYKNKDLGLQMLRQNGLKPGTYLSNNIGYKNADIKGYVGTGAGRIDETKFQDKTNYEVQKNTDFTYKIIVRDGFATTFIDGVQIETFHLTEDLAQAQTGGFGLSTHGDQINVKKIRISPDISGETADLTYDPKPSYTVDIYEPTTSVQTAPIVMAKATNATKNVAADSKRPSALFFDLKLESGTLNAYDGTTFLGSFTDLYNTNKAKTNVGVSIEKGDKATAAALGTYLEANKIGNLWVLSNDVEVLEVVTQKAPFARGILDTTKGTFRAPGNISYDFGTDYSVRTKPNFTYTEYTEDVSTYTTKNVYDFLFTLGYRSILINEAQLTKDLVHDLQALSVNVYATPKDNHFYDLITFGVNGILSTNHAENIKTLESAPFNNAEAPILVRGGAVVGHRGDMGNTNLYPENSVESIVSSAQSGASFVEFDLYMSKDGEIVTSHHNNPTKASDENPEDYYKYAADCPLSPEEQAANNAKAGITERNWYGDMEYLVANTNGNSLKRLEDIYKAVDTEYPDLNLSHEFKDYRIECFNRAVELMEQYNLRYRSSVVCFDPVFTAYTSSMGIETSYTSAPGDKDSQNPVGEAEFNHRPRNSVWCAQWTRTNKSYLESMKHFGQMVMPWPTMNEAEMDSYYVQGYHGFTTNVPHNTDEYIKKITAEIDTTGKVKAYATTLADHKIGTFDNSSLMVEKWWITSGISDGVTTFEITDFDIVAVSGNPMIDNATKTVTGTVSDRVAVRYKKQLNNVSYYALSESFAPATDTFIVGETNVTARFTPEQSNCTALIALYKNSELVGIKELQITNETTINETVAFTQKPDTLKLMYWENLTTLKPLCEAKTINLN